MDELSAWDDDYVRQELCQEDECPQLEKKASAKFTLNAKGQPDGATKEELAKQVTAFSNSGYGVLVYGVGEDKSLDAGIPTMIGTQTTKDWAEAIIPKLVYPSVAGCVARTIQLAGHHSSDRAVLAIEIPLSERRPHWTSDKEIPYVRAGAHSLPMRPQTLLDIASRGATSAAEIETANPIGTPRLNGTTRIYNVQPLVRLLNGPLCEQWSFEMRVRSGYITIRHSGSVAHGDVSEPNNLYLRGKEPLFIERSTPVSRVPIELIWDRATAEDEIEAVLYVGSAMPVRRIFRTADVDKFRAKILSRVAQDPELNNFPKRLR